MKNIIKEEREIIKINQTKIELQLKGEKLSSNFSEIELKVLYKLFENGNIKNLNISYIKFDRRFGNCFLTFESTNEKTISENIREFNLIKTKQQKKETRRKRDRERSSNFVVNKFHREKFCFLYYEKLKKEEEADLNLNKFMNDEFSILKNMSDEELEKEVQKNLNNVA